MKAKAEAIKQEVRRAKRGKEGIEAAYHQKGKAEVKCSNEDLLKICAEGFRRMKREDEETGRLLRVTRACGWLSYQADPVSKTLVRTDEQAWYKGREEELAEVSHRHPQVWWKDWYEAKDGEEPLRPDFKKCGGKVQALEYTRDEFPEQAPGEQTKLKCLLGRKSAMREEIDLK